MRQGSPRPIYCRVCVELDCELDVKIQTQSSCHALVSLETLAFNAGDEDRTLIILYTHTCQRSINLLEDLLSKQVNEPCDYLMRSNKENKTDFIQAQRAQRNSHH